MIELSYRLSNLYWRLVARLYYRPQFGALGEGSIIRRPMMILGAKSIFIGDRCGIRDGARLEVLKGSGRIEIGSDTCVEQNVHIVSGGKIQIGERVSIAPGCVILDVNHVYQDVSSGTRVAAALESEPGFVEIGDECFLGAYSVILPGVRLGKHCVVGASSVVTKSMPPYTVCVGAPARAVRHFDPASQTWV